ncbi:hypothetical protein L2E82_35987 [Cichorium intybus]|uniref:Uncharacterized protein n=1 Tax=Cichorium intybus TaxID=13427 RepID=A0ACB9BQ92_CICIN|nr:hypothetical protein L2E82_35987 [Cichorium intybus]
MEEPTNSAKIHILERLQDVEVEQTLRGHRNATDLLESGYSKDEIDEGIEETQTSNQMLKLRKKSERILKRKLSQQIGSTSTSCRDPLTID